MEMAELDGSMGNSMKWWYSW